jgi:LysM repeat protein
MSKIIAFAFFGVAFFSTNLLAHDLDSLRLENKDGKKFIIHKVDKGQTLFGTLRKYGSSLAEYKLANPDADLNIKIGQILRIPYFKAINNQIVTTAKAGLVEDAPTLNLHLENGEVAGFDEYFAIGPKVKIVEAGNTLFKIAKNAGISITELRKLNSLTTDLIEVGQVLMISNGKLLKGKTMPKVVFDENIAIANFENKAKETIKVKDEKPVINEISKIPAEMPKVVQAKSKPVEKVIDVPKANVPKPVEKVVESVKPVLKEQAITKQNGEQKIEMPISMENINGERVVKVEEGIAEIIEVESKSGKYLALHKTAPLGTLIQVRNETTSATVWVKVIGRLPELDQNQNVIIKLSPKAMDRVSPIDKRFRAKINYSL